MQFTVNFIKENFHGERGKYRKELLQAEHWLLIHVLLVKNYFLIRSSRKIRKSTELHILTKFRRRK
jgi:hypothetical protein